MAACNFAQPTVSPSLVQIRRAYAAEFGELRLSVESDVDGWTAEVHSNGRTLYRAQRCSLRAAQSVAVEFANWSAGALERNSPEAVARHLSWRESY